MTPPVPWAITWIHLFVVVLALSYDDEWTYEYDPETGLPKGLFPEIFNLALNAVITVNATCGETGSESYCKIVEHVGGPQCGVCNAISNNPNERHPIANAIDGTNKWWQSPTLSNGKQFEWVTITLDLRQIFQVAYVIIKSGISPLPGNWILERSIDGVSYRPWQFYAVSDAECWEAYHIPPTIGTPTYKSDDEIICTSFYSRLNDFEQGEIHTSLVNGRPGAEVPSEPLREFTKARYVRLRLQKIRTLNADLMTIQTDDPDKIDKSVTKRYFYSVRDISIGGQCVCSGHAKECPTSRNGDLQCRCEHNTCGTACNVCCPLFNQKLWRAGTNNDGAACEECQCFGHAKECVYDPNVAAKKTSLNTEGKYEGGGVCVNCTAHTTGINCENCQDGYYRPQEIRRDHRNPCRKCSCSGPGVTGVCIKDDSHIFEGLYPGDCFCREGFAGPKCDRCAEGYRNYPDCEPCPCHFAGTIDGTCEGECICKKNVDGERCDKCKKGFYDLSASNPEGCSPCYCFDITDSCTSSDWGIEVVEEPELWLVTDFKHRRVVEPTYENGRLLIAHDDVSDFSMYYWEAPERYLGNKLYSYGGDLKFVLSYVIARGDTSGTYIEGPDVILEGNTLKIGHNWSIKHDEGNVTIVMPLREHNWFVLDRAGEKTRLATREEFTLVLHDLERLLVRAKYHQDQIEGAKHNVEMRVASKDSKSYKKMTSVESCICPPGYAGLSCELCAPGYRRVNNTLVGGTCERCDCNNHAESCDPYTGKCQHCLHFTTGARCERCLPGYYGNPLIGFPDDCKPCSCPLTIPSNNFSPSCTGVATTTGERDYVCTECPIEYAGKKCERCGDGYYGSPTTPGGFCLPCECGPNVDKSSPGYCDHITGRCLRCIGNTGGWNCQDCLPGHYGNADTGDCKPCDCSEIGSLSSQCTRNTGQCQCKPNFTGRKCDRCIDGYGTMEKGCIPCHCNPIGSLSQNCDPITGKCPCRPGVFGTHCDSCLDGHYGFSVEGCKWCGCDPHGSTDRQCNERTGQCSCRPHIVGRACDRCEPGYWNLLSERGCEPCNCNTTGSHTVQCDAITGQCSCKQGVGGKYCDACRPGYFSFSYSGCRACDPCDAPGHICDEKTGRCICPKNTGGPRCSRCNTGAWGYDPEYGCKLCNCNRQGSFSPNCDDRTGQCQCLEGFEGQHCDKCRYGYYNFPNCKRCDCHVDGTLPEACNERGHCQCDENGQCPCKTNTEGLRCDRCKPFMFGMTKDNPRGCTECLCFGRTNKCGQGKMMWSQITIPPRDMIVEVGDTHLETVHHFKVIPGTSGLAKVGIRYVSDQPLYWALPDEFLKDKVLSYNGVLRFGVESQSNDVFPDTQLLLYPLVVLQGNTRIFLQHTPVEASPSGIYTARMHEDEWRHLDNPQIPVTRTELMVALQNVNNILIRATEGPDIKYARLTEVSLETAVPVGLNQLTPYIAHGVEICRCPFQYTGSSCQDPAEGYYRRRKPNYLDSKDVLDLVGWAEPCPCNNRTRRCDIETGICYNCTGNTVGSYCNLCAQGFYGDPTRGPCIPCACPLPTNSFSDTCQTEGPDYSCTDCQAGYTGRRCEKCADGYYGNPLVESGRCLSCQCSPYGSHSRVCDKVTGQCPCLPGIVGRDCTACQRRHILTEYGCKSCDDKCTGLLLNDVEEMTEWLLGLNISDVHSAPWYHLLIIENRTRILRNDLIIYERLIRRGEHFHRNYSYHFSLNITADILLFKVQNLLQQAPKVDQDAFNTLRSAEELLIFIKSIWKEIQDIVEELKRHRDPSSPGTGLARILAEAEAILRELQRRKLDFYLEEAQRENRKAHALLARVKNLLFRLPEIGDLGERLDRLNRLLRDLIQRIENEVQRPTSTALNIIHVQAGVLDNIKNLIGQSVDSGLETNDTLLDARDWLEKAKSEYIDALLQFEHLPGLAAELGIETKELEYLRGILDRINYEYRDKYVKAAERHAALLAAQADRLARDFSETREMSQYPLMAAQVFQRILDALKDAEEAARNASIAADQAYLEAYPRFGDSLVDRAGKARTDSRDLLEEAKRLRDVEVPSLLSSLNIKGQIIRAIAEDVNQGKHNISYINRVLDLLERGITEKLKRANEIGMAALGKADDANERIDEIIPKLKNLTWDAELLESGSTENLEDIRKKIEEARRNIVLSDRMANRTEEAKNRIHTKHNQLQLNLKDLKNKILKARQQASSIRVSLSGNGECTRTFKPEIEPSTTNHIVLNYAIKEPNQNTSLLLIANEKNESDFMAVDMVNRRIRFLWNAGQGTTTLTHSLNIETNDVQLSDDKKWYKIEIVRTGTIATLSVKRKPDGGKDDPQEVERISSSEYGKIDVDSSSVFVIGRVPEILDSKLVAAEVVNHDFVGCLHEVIIDGKQVGLWNFVNNQGCGGCKSGPSEEIDASAYQFKGEGYSKVEQARRVKKEEYVIRIFIKTFDEDSLLFICPNIATMDYLSLELEGGRILFQVRHASGSPFKLITREKYNTGQWVKIIASYRISKGGPPYKINMKLLANDEDLDGGGSVKGYLNLKKQHLYFGSSSPGFPTEKFSSVNFMNYIGCMKEIEALGTSFDLLKDEAFAVDSGCKDRKVKLVSFKGKGYLELRGITLGEHGNFSFSFQTTQENALLMISTFLGRGAPADKEQHFYSAALSEGKLKLIFSGGATEVVIESSKTYNDGKFHTITAFKQGRRLRANVDDERIGEGRLPKGSNVIEAPADGGLFFGGIKNSISSQAASREPLSGTIKDAVFNNELLGFNHQVSFIGAGIGRVLKSKSVAPVDQTRMVEDNEQLARCAEMESYSLEERAVKFGDSLNSYVKMNLDRKLFKKSFAFSFDFRTFYPNGLFLILKHDKKPRYFAVMLKNSRVVAELQTHNRTALTSDNGALHDGDWHSVEVKVEVTKKNRVKLLKLNVDKKKRTQEAEVRGRLPVREPLYVGGIPEGLTVSDKLQKESFKGCIREFRLNGNFTDLATGSHHDIGSCFVNVELGAYFNGHAYAVFNDGFNIDNKLDVEFQFKTTRLNGIFLSITEKTGLPSLGVELYDGQVITSVDLGNGTFKAVKAFKSKYDVCDGNWHLVQVLFEGSSVSLKVDNHSVEYGFGEKTFLNEPRTHSPLYVGGLPDYSSKGVLNIRDNFVGCLRNIAINENRVDWLDMFSLSNVLPNSCPAF